MMRAYLFTDAADRPTLGNAFVAVVINEDTREKIVSGIRNGRGFQFRTGDGETYAFGPGVIVHAHFHERR